MAKLTRNNGKNAELIHPEATIVLLEQRTKLTAPLDHGVKLEMHTTVSVQLEVSVRLLTPRRKPKVVRHAQRTITAETEECNRQNWPIVEVDSNVLLVQWLPTLMLISKESSVQLETIALRSLWVHRSVQKDSTTLIQAEQVATTVQQVSYAQLKPEEDKLQSIAQLDHGAQLRLHLSQTKKETAQLELSAV